MWQKYLLLGNIGYCSGAMLQIIRDALANSVCAMCRMPYIFGILFNFDSAVNWWCIRSIYEIKTSTLFQTLCGFVVTKPIAVIPGISPKWYFLFLFFAVDLGILHALKSSFDGIHFSPNFFCGRKLYLQSHRFFCSGIHQHRNKYLQKRKTKQSNWYLQNAYRQPHASHWWGCKQLFY